MSKITLTDRISVSVRAKTDTQSSQQKVDTGKNIAKSLGVNDYNDTDAATIGNTSKPTITDENGNEWVSMQDIIDAGKKMHQDGAFEERHTEGYEFVFPGFGTITEYSKYGWINEYSIPSGWNLAPYITDRNGNTAIHIFAKEMTGTPTKNGNAISISPVTVTYNGIQYSFFYGSFSLQSNTYTSMDFTETFVTSLFPSDQRNRSNTGGDPSAIPRTANQYYAAPWLFGPITGGSLIDWAKPDDEIEEDIRRLHETWDVSEHEGAVTANGTYVLAGPIEYNDADPDSHSSGDF